jgi:D-glycero-D-manno-heptose 1,7-bisphosphate phosphatase
MVTNQAGIAKDKFNFEEMNEGLEGIKKFYKKKGIIFDYIQYCPYHKEGVVKEYAFDTILRKPNPGMILKACEKIRIDLKNSEMLGDNSDIDNIKLPYLKCNIIK